MKHDWLQKFMFGKDKQEPQTIRVCEHEGCAEPGLYPAPKSRQNLREYYYFCLDHVREYNRCWNFFEGYTTEQIYRQQSEDAGWARPTWPSWQYNEDNLRAAAEKLYGMKDQDTSRNRKKKPHKAKQVITEDDARTVLGVEPMADEKEIKIKYRKLVKKYHPDVNKDKNAEEQFKLVSQAYNILKRFFTTNGY